MQSTTDKTNAALQLYRWMVTAREMDLIEQNYTARGEAFFHVSGAGHEGAVALWPHLRPGDWLHCHYRDKALMLARGITPRMFFLSLFNKDDSHSRGRQMNAHMSAPDLRVLSIVGPVGNSALQAVGVAEEVRNHADQPVVLCALGEGTTQESEVTEAIVHASRIRVPVLFVIHDNAFAISTSTRRRTFYSHPTGELDEFVGIPITRIDGREVLEAESAFGAVVERMRNERTPQIVVFNVERLHNHTNADDQRVYRSAEEIAAAAASGDPIVRLRERLIAAGAEAAELEAQRAQIVEELQRTAREAQRAAEPHACFEAKRPLPARLTDPSAEYRGSAQRDTTMLEAIRAVLDARMEHDARVTLFGEDIEDPKGDVFGVTRGLSIKYPGRVQNSPLSESLIVGTAVGRALAGARPVAFLQFADFLPIAYNQIFAELGAMHWRTDGGWSAPVIVMVTAGGYRPGLGPFHASTMEAIAAHTPGVDVFMPSNAADAAGLLNAAFESERPTIFFYPKNQLNDRAGTTSADVARQLVPIGRARVARAGEVLTMVGWGNTVPLMLKTADLLATHGREVEVIDLRSLVPWDTDTVIASVERTGRLLVAHEDNHTAGFGAEVVATVAERSRVPVAARRVTRADTFVPCNFGNQLEVLPSYRRILETSLELLDGAVQWQQDAENDGTVFTVPAVGSSPSDETITIVSWAVQVGQTIAEGELLAEVEADKAASEMKSPVGGTVTELLLAEGDNVPVGTPVARIRPATASTGEATATGSAPVKTITREDPGTPVISWSEAASRTAPQRPAIATAAPAAATSPAATALTNATAPTAAASPNHSDRQEVAGIVAVTVRRGSRIVSNAEVAALSEQWSADDIEKRTGIAFRPWVQNGETVVSLAYDASAELLLKTGIESPSIDLIVFATGTPSGVTPSMATLLQHRLGQTFGALFCPAYDINAACSGYIYGLQIAYDYLSNRPSGRVLLVTSEVLSPRLNMDDPGTAPIFGDAATATLLVGAAAAERTEVRAWVQRPVTAAAGEDGTVLSVPTMGEGPIAMDGPKVYLEAVRAMMDTLKQAATEAGLDPAGLDLYVPHQANQRIINAVRQRLKLEERAVYSNIRTNGNTSSSTIPICLSEILPGSSAGRKVGLTAFGGGFTFGAAILIGA